MAVSILVKSFQISALATAIALVGCGGGGNDTIQPAIGNGGTTNTGTGGTTGTGTGTTTTTPAVNVGSLTLTDVNGNLTTTINSSGANAKVVVKDASGNPISGAIVTFSATGGVTFGTSNGAVLTNANGEATISLKPTDATTSGAYSISATASSKGVSATTSPYNFSLQSANITLSNVVAANTSLASGGSTNITMVTTDTTSNTAQNNVVVNFTASCGTFTNSSVTASNQGNITTTYKAIDANGNLCEGAQTITATTASGGVSKTVPVNIAAIQASSIVYTTANEVKLGASNSGSSSSGQVEFTVYANGVPAANQQVKITKNYAPSDFSFGTLGNQNELTLTSDSTGKVTVTLYPGALPGPVELKATLASDANVSALSKNVSVATGRATQNGMSLSLSKNTLAKGVDGDTATVTVRLVDRVGNAVPDGTVVSFVAEGGKITPNCSTVDGVCTAIFTTQNPRPVDDRVSVIAYVEGDKSYTDSNGNNKFDIGEPLVSNIGGFYRDDNENNQHDLGEYVYTRQISGSAMACGASSFGQPNLITQVLSTNPLSTTSQQCDNQLTAILRSEFVFGLAENVPTFVPPFTTFSANPFKGSINRYSFKMYGNGAQTVSMPAGTKISVTTTDRTTFTPKASASNGIITVSGMNPAYSNVSVTMDNIDYNVSLQNGYGTTTYTPPTSAPATPPTVTVNYTDESCKAEIIGGYATVPNLVNLSIGKVLDSEVSYTLQYEGCSPSDDIRIITDAPSPAANKHTEIVSVIK